MILLSAAPAIAEPASRSKHLEQRVERRYVLTARVRLLLFWYGCNNVGAGRITWSSDDNGRYGLEFLIGSDPERVPMRINRWGYIGEFHQRDKADILGVMTQTEDGSAEAAKLKLETARGSGHPYRAMRSSIEAGKSSTTVLHLAFPRTVTYRELETVRQAIAAREGLVQRFDVPEQVALGFLSAIDTLIEDSVATYGSQGRLAQGTRRVYVYASGVYDVVLVKTKAHSRFLIGNTRHKVLESDFEVRKRGTNHTTSFRVIYGTDPPISAIPVRIVFRPNSWFEAELNIEASQGS